MNTVYKFLHSHKRRAKEKKQVGGKNAIPLKSNENKPKPPGSSAAADVSAAAPEGGKIIYSKFDLLASGLPEENRRQLSKDRKRKGDSLLQGNNAEKLLKKVENRQRRLEKLKSLPNDSTEGLSETQKRKWQMMAALQRVQGQKVKDDPELLRKSIAKRQKLKDKSRKKWDQRVATQKHFQDKRQEKRTQNLDRRKEKKMKGKMDKLKKKGRFVPGF